MKPASSWVWALIALAGCVDGTLPRRTANDPADPNAAEAPALSASTASAPADAEGSIPRLDHGHTHNHADAAVSP